MIVLTTKPIQFYTATVVYYLLATLGLQYPLYSVMPFATTKSQWQGKDGICHRSNQEASNSGAGELAGLDGRCSSRNSQSPDTPQCWARRKPLLKRKISLIRQKCLISKWPKTKTVFCIVVQIFKFNRKPNIVHHPENPILTVKQKNCWSWVLSIQFHRTETNLLKKSKM